MKKTFYYRGYSYSIEDHTNFNAMAKSKKQVKKPVFKTPYNHVAFEDKLEPGGGKSMTVPDQTMTVREIMDRSRRGLPIDGQKVTFYDDDGTQETLEMPDIRKMDLSEIQEMIRENAEAIRTMQKVLEEKKMEQEEKELYEKFKKKFQEQELPFKKEDQQRSDPPPGS